MPSSRPRLVSSLCVPHPPSPLATGDSSSSWLVRGIPLDLAGLDVTATQQEVDPFLTLTLLLSEPVRFTRRLKDTTFAVGQLLQLVCTYSGSPRVSVSWTKDGKPIWASYQYNMKTTDSSCVLEILNSDRPTAAGTYACEISNGAGSDVCHARLSLGNVSKPLLALSFSCFH